MITYSIIQKSQLEGAHRLDAEYFMPTYLHLSSSLDKLLSVPLDSLAEVTASAFYPAATELYSDTDGLPFIRGVDIVNFPIITEDQPFERLPVDFLSQYKNIKTLKKGDIVISKVGTPCYASVINGELEKVALSRTVLGLRNIKNVNTYYLLAFLRSKYGFDQLEREIELQIQEQLTLERVRKIKVYVPPQNLQGEIALLIIGFYQEERSSKKFYSEAEGLLLEELGLKDFQVEDDLSFVVDFSEVKKSARIDAEYFQPKYEEIIKKIEKYNGGFDLVKNQFKQNKSLSKKDKDYYNYVEISDVNVSNGEIIPNKIERKEIPANAKVALRNNDLLISKVRPYRGAVSFIDFEVEDLLGSGAFTVLQEKTSYKKEVLMIFLKLDFIKDMLLRYNCGTSYPIIKDEDILNLKIPLIKLDIQEEIAELVRKSHEARKKSKELLQQAKIKVEEMIGKGGKVNG